MTTIEYRVPYGDTDKMGVVYYAHYFRYFEMLRNELLRTSGKSYKQIEEEDRLMFPVMEAYCEYIYPARYDDILQISGFVARIEANRFRIEYVITEKLTQIKIATGFTLHICLSLEGKPRKLPEYIKKLVAEV